jgi:hypothetical protein
MALEWGVLLSIAGIAAAILIIRAIPGAIESSEGKVKISLGLFLALVGSALVAVIIWVGWFGLVLILGLVVNWAIKRSFWLG